MIYKGSSFIRDMKHRSSSYYVLFYYDSYINFETDIVSALISTALVFMYTIGRSLYLVCIGSQMLLILSMLCASYLA
jgi:hypothetical protein